MSDLLRLQRLNVDEVADWLLGQGFIVPMTRERAIDAAEKLLGGREVVLRQLWEPVESHREYDNVLMGTWEFGARADAEIPVLYVEVTDDD